MTLFRALPVTRAQLGLITAVYLMVFTALLDVHIVIIALPALSWEP